jgi:hypothetical protein
MIPLTDILASIEAANDRYRTLKLSFASDLTEILRDLSCASYDLIEHKRLSKNEWLDAYNKFKGSNAAKERFADSEVRELGMIRDVMRHLKTQQFVIGQTVSLNKNN